MHILTNERCKKVIYAYSELFENEDIIVLDAGKYGFVKLQYYEFGYGFDSMEIFVNSEKLFNNLWQEWFNIQLFALVSECTDEEITPRKIFQNLSSDKQKELLNKRYYFENKVNE